MIKLCVVLVLCFMPYRIAIRLHYADCGSSATVHSVFLEPCEIHHVHGIQECIIYEQHNYTATINFTATVNHDKAFNFASGDVTGTGNLELWTFSPNDACSRDVKCPIQAGLAQIYTATVTVPITNPKRMAAKWQVKTENDRFGTAPDIICFVFPVKIV
ncbi:putative protein heh-1 [Mercenaria mercenaria]|uniref:putative protein heh-1 n=1 Tax=Mercenaria mercenaria TaxID=6596 RepID=UPI00234E91C4|nr:putative protein heh-1 [Mercenaria mercenaria]